MALGLPERRKTDDLMIVDADIHVSDTPGALAPYCAMPWRKSVEALVRARSATSTSPASRRRMKLDPPIPGGHAARSVRHAAEMRTGLDRDRHRHRRALPR